MSTSQHQSRSSDGSLRRAFTATQRCLDPAGGSVGDPGQSAELPTGNFLKIRGSIHETDGVAKWEVCSRRVV